MWTAWTEQALNREPAGRRSGPQAPSVFDTATLAGAALGQTVLARALQACGLSHDAAAAHSAIYDAEQTADLFCLLVNRMRPLFADFGAPAVTESEGSASGD